MELDSKCPTGPIETRWDRHHFSLKLVNPANKRKYTILVVGTGLAGGSAAASLAELGYNVKCFCFQDSPRRAHSIAAQGGINAAKNYHNDGDSVYRLFYDTVKGGDFRARESNVYRLAQISLNIIDQCVAQGVPFAREYSGYLETSLIGGMQMFDIPKLYLLGGPDQATQTAAVFIYNQAFSGSYLYNREAAASMILFVIIAILASMVFYILRDKDAIRLNKQRKALIKDAKLRARLAEEGASI